MRDFFATVFAWILIFLCCLWYAEYKGIQNFCLVDKEWRKCVAAPWKDESK